MKLSLVDITRTLGCSNEQIIWQPLAGSECRDMCKAAGAEQSGASQPALYSVIPTGAAIDSRVVVKGNLFFCLPGTQVDGHDYAYAAAQQGACAIIAQYNPFASLSSEVAESMVLPPVFLVEDVAVALRHLAKMHRETSIAKVVGITGTAGKTSVKDVLVQVLSVRAQTDCNAKNFNNQIGLPLSMLNASAFSAFWVMEVGISEAHDMAVLGEILQPDIALVLNVGEGHTQGLGDKGVAFHKAQLFSYVQPGGIAVFCKDYPLLSQEVSAIRQDLLARGVSLYSFSTQTKDAHCFGAFRYSGLAEHSLYTVESGEQVEEILAPFKGPYGAENVAAIFLLARLLGLHLEEILQGFSLAKLPEQRFNCYRTGDVTVIDDSYNANPLSMKRMLESVAIMAAEENAPVMLVLGEMGELGTAARQAHYDLGQQVAAIQPLFVLWKGSFFEDLRAGLREGNYAGGLYPIAGGAEFLGLVEEWAPSQGFILFKGSRSNNLERLVAIFYDYMTEKENANAV